MASLTEQLDNLYTTTWQSMQATASDNIFDHVAFFFWLNKTGNIRKLAGGRFIAEPLIFANSSTAGWQTKAAQVALEDTEILQIAKYDWSYLVGNVVRFWQDDQQNRGKHQIMSLMEAKLTNVQNDMRNTLSTALAAETTSNGVVGLQNLVSDTAAYATAVGGIIPSTNSWWRNQTTDMTTESFATFGVNRMRTMFNNVSQNLGDAQPDIILSGQEAFEFYTDTLLGYYRFSDRTLVDAGFQSQEFNGVPMIWDTKITETGSDKMYFLNTRYLWLYVDPAFFFEMTPWKVIPNQANDRTAQVMLAASFVTNRRRVQGVIHNIDTA